MVFLAEEATKESSKECLRDSLENRVNTSHNNVKDFIRKKKVLKSIKFASRFVDNSGNRLNFEDPKFRLYTGPQFCKYSLLEALAPFH